VESHRCPRCGARHAERRTPRTLREKAALTLLGRRPYRCLECGRRFGDRPHGREPQTPAPEATPPGATRLADVRRRRTRWVVDAGDLPLTRFQLYGLIALGALLLVLIVLVLRAVWPESTGGVRGVD
jgi:DNA-directed RNA polymerase subunit RPC12/RpoP